MGNKINDSRDDKIKQLLKKELPKERENPWFTRKVLNRLPPRRERSNIIEKWVFLIVTVCVTIGLILQSTHMMTAPIIYVRDFLTMGCFLITFTGLSVWIVYPYIKE